MAALFVALLTLFAAIVLAKEVIPDEVLQKLLDFPTGTEDYMIIDDKSKIPEDWKPDKEIKLNNRFSMSFFKIFEDDAKTKCSYQLVTIDFLEPNHEKERMFVGRVGCLVGHQEHTVDKLAKVVGEDTLVFRIIGNYCMKATVVWVEEKNEARIKNMCSYACEVLQDSTCEESTIKGIDDVSALFGGAETKKMWSKDHLQSQMNIRLVSKSWKPNGPSSTTDDKLDVYSWSVKEAFEALQSTPLYEYDESLMPEVEALLTCEEFDKSLPTIMIVHPLSTDANHNFVTTTITALAMRNLHRYNNVLAVDMPGLNINMLMSVMNSVMMGPPMYEPMAEALADLFILGVEKQLMRPEDIHLIGWSYSGQLVGYMGRYIKQKTAKRIGSIIALDPNGNIQNPAVVHISSKDAEVVHIYHTNAFPCGTLARLGTADFVFDGGFILPECVAHPIPMFCSHFHVVQRWWYVILFGQTLFKARECESVLKFNAGVCNTKPEVFLTYPITNKHAKGQYFLRTLLTKPYGMGDQGSLADPKVTERLSKVIAQNKIDLSLFMILSTNVVQNEDKGQEKKQ